MDRRTATVIGTAAAAWVALGGGCLPGEPLDLPDDLLELHQGIVGGQETTEWLAVGAYLIDGGNGGLCTATLVAPDVALTASHCVEGSGQQDRFYIGHDIYSATSEDTIWISDAIAHPSYNLSSQHPHDIAVLLLNHEAEGVPWIPVNTTTMDSSWEDRLLRYVGFGSDTYYGGPGAGTKRETDIRLYEVYSLEFVHYMQGTNTCSGDSGGPAFVELDGEWYHAGVISSGFAVNGGQDSCSGGGIEMRVDAEMSFLDDYLDPSATPYDDDDTADDDDDTADDDTPPPLAQLPAPRVDEDSYDIPEGCTCTNGRATPTSPILGLLLTTGAALLVRRRR